MPRRKNPVPKYERHKPSGQAYVRYTDAAGIRRTVYLGKYDTPASRQEYERPLLSLRCNPDGGKIQSDGLSVAEATLASQRT